jgi:hypothetical protein
MIKTEIEPTLARHLGAWLIATIVLVAAANIAPAAAQVFTPPPGPPLRADLMNALRPTVEAEIGGRIEFVVSEFRVLQVWAYTSVRPQRPGGVPIDWLQTKFREAWRNDQMSDLVLALLWHDGSHWRVMDYAIGPTDVIWEEWLKRRGLPRQLFID